ncbi:MAG: ABC transporter ATP-binding protein [Bacteroidota bacterium]
MSEAAIKAESVSKVFQLGVVGSYDLRSTLVNSFHRLTGGLAGSNGHNDQEFWALKDVSFTVDHGQVIGIIGRNGAGKSTLLKVLSHITEPTSGKVSINGRVASLLEVGTGFHPELTGKENIYLNGSILGMTRKEIKKKFDEIVDFSGVEKFLDTPVKRYSSGMYVRLAFAVAAHLEPEILVIDEVLAVGDAEFQQKCLGKMKDASGQGRTVLFVSHQMNAVRELCEKTILLHQGQIKAYGGTIDVIKQYLNKEGNILSEWINDGKAASLENLYFTPTRFAVVDESLNPIDREISNDEKVGILIEGDVQEIDISLTVGFALYTIEGQILYWSLQTDREKRKWPVIEKGKNKLICWLPSHFLNEGGYRVEMILSLHFREWLSRPEVNAPVLQFSIRGGLSNSPYWMSARPGHLGPILPFEKL